MLCRFRLELDVAVGADAVPTVIVAARQRHAADGGADAVDGDGAERPIPAGVFIDAIEEALMELVERNPLLVNANVEIERVTCEPSPASSEPEVHGEVKSERGIRASAAMADTEEAEDDLEEFETGLYLCRWPNCEFRW